MFGSIMDSDVGEKKTPDSEVFRMKRELIEEKLYEKYIAPTKLVRKDYIGIEIEMPIINLNKEPVDFSVVHGLTGAFQKEFGFVASGIDDDGNVYAAENKQNGDILSYDCSYNNLEISMGKERDLNILHQRFTAYYEFIQNYFAEYHYTLSGLGINPYRNYNHNIPIPNERYRMLFHHLESYKKYRNVPMYFHNYPKYGMFSSASQVQLDVGYDELTDTINTFEKLEPVKAVLFANSVLVGEDETNICNRDMFWENSTHGINPHNIGMYGNQLESVEDLQSYIESTSMYCVMRNGKYINFSPINVMEYFSKEKIEGEYFSEGEYHTIEFKPEIDDLSYLRTFKFEDLTFRGTIEFRSVCCQPIADSMTVAAFHLGLKNRLRELKELLEHDRVIYHKGYTAPELRKIFNKREMPAFVEEDELYGLVASVLDLANEGLQDRGLKEEVFLKPLYDRVRLRSNPARTLLDQKDAGVAMEDIILEYARLK